MSALIQQVPALLGVLIGALCSFFVTRLSERERWRREQSTRWDDRRIEAYTVYADAVKTMGHIALRICAARGLGPAIEPLDPEQGLPMLAAADADRSVKWESVLLLGSKAAIAAGRAYHKSVWELERAARGGTMSPSEFAQLVDKVGQARQAYYEAARQNLIL